MITGSSGMESAPRPEMGSAVPPAPSAEARTPGVETERNQEFVVTQAEYQLLGAMLLGWAGQSPEHRAHTPFIESVLAAASEYVPPKMFINIDAAKRAQQVQEIVETEFFQGLRAQAGELRASHKDKEQPPEAARTVPRPVVEQQAADKSYVVRLSSGDRKHLAEILESMQLAPGSPESALARKFIPDASAMNIAIDQAKRRAQVEQITQTDAFAELRAKAQALRQKKQEGN